MAHLLDRMAGVNWDATAGQRAKAYFQLLAGAAIAALSVAWWWMA